MGCAQSVGSVIGQHGGQIDGRVGGGGIGGDRQDVLHEIGDRRVCRIGNVGGGDPYLLHEAEIWLRGVVIVQGEELDGRNAICLKADELAHDGLCLLNRHASGGRQLVGFGDLMAYAVGGVDEFFLPSHIYRDHEVR